MRDKWRKAKRIKEIFLEKNTDWLSTVVTFGNNTDISTENENAAAVLGRGRRSQSFEDSSERLKRRKTADVTPDCYSAEAALSLIIEYRMFKHVYQAIRSGALERNSKMYPSYKSVLGAKKKSYPPKDDITITESKAAVKLQALFDHTADRILIVQN
ncbi:hypothetical protein JTB14_014957 [Gonioctena quinquepunctata]|nr:hypothetical protein JTB14_014957 [Gonioctena quinquepunctata]